MAKIKIKTDKVSINLSDVKLDEFSGAWQWVKDVLGTMHNNDVMVKTNDEKNIEFISGHDIFREARKALEWLGTEIDREYSSDESDKIRKVFETKNDKKGDHADFYQEHVVDDFYNAASGTFIFKETYPAALAVKYAAETMIKYMWEKTKPCVEQVAFAEKVDEDDIPFDVLTLKGYEIEYKAKSIADDFWPKMYPNTYNNETEKNRLDTEFYKICEDTVETFNSYVPSTAAKLTGEICARFFYELGKAQAPKAGEAE